MLLNHPDPRQSINNVYDLPSTEQAIKHLHICASLPTNATWLKSIRLINYTTWSGLTTKLTNNYFPEAEKTQKGHIQHKRQVVRSTRENIDSPTCIRWSNNQRNPQKSL